MCENCKRGSAFIIELKRRKTQLYRMYTNQEAIDITKKWKAECRCKK